MSKNLKRASYEVVPDGEALFFSYHDHKNAVVRNRAEKYLYAYNLVCRLCYDPGVIGVFYWVFFIIDNHAYCIAYYENDGADTTWEQIEKGDCGFSADTTHEEPWSLLSNYAQNIVFLDLLYGDLTTEPLCKDGVSRYFKENLAFLTLHLPTDWDVDSGYVAKQTFENTIDYDYEVEDPYIIKKSIAYLNAPEVTEVTLQSSPSMARIYTSVESDNEGFLTNLTKIRSMGFGGSQVQEDDPYGLKRWETWSYQPYWYLSYFGDLAFFTPRLYKISELSVDFEDYIIFEPINILREYWKVSTWKRNLSKIFLYAKKWDLVAFQQQEQFVKDVRPDQQLKWDIIDAIFEVFKYSSSQPESRYSGGYKSKSQGRIEQRAYKQIQDDSESFTAVMLTSADQVKDIYFKLRDWYYEKKRNIAYMQGAIAITMGLLKTVGRLNIPFIKDYSGTHGYI